MRIEIKQLTLINFKGIRSKTINFDHVTNIFGANQAGKTTIFDGFMWLLFGKNSQDSTMFNIKPLDSFGNKADRVENEVNGTFLIDGETVHIRRIHKEKWVKKRGEEEATFEGNEQLFFWNDVPLQAGEFKHKVESIIKESTFKAITNPAYFPSMKWQDQRAILEQIAGGISDESVAGKRDEFQFLLQELAGKSFKEYKAEIAVRKKKLKDELQHIPSRIDEAERSKPQPIDEESIKAELAKLQEEHDALEKAIIDRNEAAELENKTIRETQQRIHDLKLERQTIEASHRAAFAEESRNASSAGASLKSAIKGFELDLKNKQLSLASYKATSDSNLSNLSANISNRTAQLEDLKKEFTRVNAKEIDESSLRCGECGRIHEDDNLENIKATFIENKRVELESINERGRQLNHQIKEYNAQREQVLTDLAAATAEKEEEMRELEAKIQALKAELEQAEAGEAAPVEPVDTRMDADPRISEIDTKIAELTEIVNNRPTVDYGDLRVNKAAVSAQIDTLKHQMSANQIILERDKRIQELKDQEKELSQQLAALEKKEFLMDQFERAKADELEARVNGLFKMARFKLFNRLVNGGDEPTCVATYNGVPYSDLNTAAQVQVGLDIINTLSAHYGVVAPIFIDGRESVTEIPETVAQIVNLIVSPEDKELRVA